VIWTVVSKINH